MFQKTLKPPPADFAPTDVMVAPKNKGAAIASNHFADEMALPEVAELNSESAWAAFNADPDTPAHEASGKPPDDLPTTSFSATQPMEYTPAGDVNKPAFSSSYMNILNEIEQDQDQRKRNPRST